MTGPGASVRGRLGRHLTALYPHGWRARYRDEMLALLEDDPPALAGLASLVVGALEAHLRPRARWREQQASGLRVRLSLATVFAYWIVLCGCGAGFQKATENYGALTPGQPLFELARGAVLGGALLGACALALGGLPLIWHALGHARASGDAVLLALLALPGLALGALGALTWLLVAIMATRAHGSPGTPALALAALWLPAALACSCVCALTPRAVLRRVEPPTHLLRRAAGIGRLLVLAMFVVTLGVSAYAGALYLDEPSLAGAASGPFGVNTGAMLAAQAVIAAAASALALRSARRARAASLVLSSSAR